MHGGGGGVVDMVNPRSWAKFLKNTTCSENDKETVGVFFQTPMGVLGVKQCKTHGIVGSQTM